MAEEKNDTPVLNSEDMDTLRILLHTVRGLSIASNVMPDYVPADDDPTE